MRIWPRKSAVDAHSPRNGTWWTSDGGIPLARFAHAAVRTLVSEPGWTPQEPEHKRCDEFYTSGPDHYQGVHLRAWNGNL